MQQVNSTVFKASLPLVGAVVAFAGMLSVIAF